MADIKVTEIWPLETGIEDLPSNWSDLAVPAMRRLETAWRKKLNEAANSNELKVFTEQLRREWAIETGAIENLYDISEGVTITLIEQGFNAAVMEPGSVDKDPEYILSLINDQKDALEGLFDFAAGRRLLSTSYIKHLHAAMTRSQTMVDSVDPSGNPTKVELLHGEYKRWPNYPRKGDIEFRYCPPEQTASEMERLVEMHLYHHEQHVQPEVDAAWLHHRFTQIHPFQDGNGRVARALASLVLIRAGLFPLVVPRDEKPVYLNALSRADSGKLRAMVQLIARRQEVALRRATESLIRLEPNSSDPDEAAVRLAEALANRDESRNARLTQRLLVLRAKFISATSTMIERIIGVLKSAHPGLEMPQILFHPDNAGEKIVSFILDNYDEQPTRPWFVISLPVPAIPNLSLVIFVYPILHDLEESVDVLFALQSENLSPLLSHPPRFLPSYDDAEVDFRVNECVEEAVTAMLDYVRRAM